MISVIASYEFCVAAILDAVGLQRRGSSEKGRRYVYFQLSVSASTLRNVDMSAVCVIELGGKRRSKGLFSGYHDTVKSDVSTT